MPYYFNFQKLLFSSLNFSYPLTVSYSRFMDTSDINFTIWGLFSLSYI